DRAAWLARCRAAYDGPLAGAGGWGHCAEANWQRHPYADHAAAIWRLDGALPKFVRDGATTLWPGGAHLPDDAGWFVAGQAKRWADFTRERARGVVETVRADGTVGYVGEFLRGHFEDTSSGQCGQAAVALLEYARTSGDRGALAIGLGLLEASERFTTPRGAQVWELSLHTPDILAAAHQVHARVLAFEQTNERRWLDSARHWAVRGLPFVYLRDDEPALPYATIAVFGATHWRAPLWIGLPVQWCGLVYADALARLGAHDDALPWRRVAEGILRAGQHMQSGAGPLVGCLPDSFVLRAARGAGPWINPGALLALDARLRGEPFDLHVLDLKDGHRAASAFPLREVDGELRAVAGPAKVQVVIDGREVVEVPGPGGR
ncbi:MAG: hypothetical protein KDK06_20690, partial [Gammaproteobacteria bacterium]|nr:hypothetical protein [Gammaproteobacteria bacterium]